MKGITIKPTIAAKVKTISITVMNALVNSLSSLSGDYDVTNYLFSVLTGETMGTNITFGSVSKNGSSLTSFMDFASVPSPVAGLNYLVAIVMAVIFVVMFALILCQLVERLLIIALLYIASPIVIGIYPLDDGNRFGIWKDLLISKMLGALSIFICLQIYFALISVFNSIISDSFVGILIRCFVMIFGLFAVNKGSHYISNLVGYSTGLAEGQSQSTGQTIMSMIRSGKNMFDSAKKSKGDQKAQSASNTLSNSLSKSGGGAGGAGSSMGASAGAGASGTSAAMGGLGVAGAVIGKAVSMINKGLQPNSSISQTPSSKNGSVNQDSAKSNSIKSVGNISNGNAQVSDHSAKNNIMPESAKNSGIKASSDKKGGKAGNPKQSINNNLGENKSLLSTDKASPEKSGIKMDTKVKSLSDELKGDNK